MIIGQIDGTYLDGAILLLGQEDLEDPVEVIVEVMFSPESLVEPLYLVVGEAVVGV